LKLFLAGWLLLTAAVVTGQTTAFEKSNGRQTATYADCIRFYEQLSHQYPVLRIREMGPTDAGEPLRLVLISGDRQFDPAVWHRQQKVVLLINNGIHPGEPDGIDASMMLARDIASKKVTLPANVAVAIIPVYNIGGALNRNRFSRANQNGPESYGFRGNARNLDLNRDFIKSDSRNARSFATIFHYVDPDLLVDNHVSDGADYQHVMTLLTTQYEKLGGALGPWLKKTFEPAVYRGMHEKGWDLVPYVNVEDSDPSKGFTQFYDSPRYSTGYAALFGTIGFMPETHMLKPYGQRVRSDYDLMVTMIREAGRYGRELIATRRRAVRAFTTQETFPLSWKSDPAAWDTISFKGFEAGKKTSQATGLPVLFYDHDRPYTRQVRFNDVFIPADSVEKPAAYVIPQGWWDVLELLQLNHIRMTRLSSDTVIGVTWYHIDEYKSLPRPYEKHHVNYAVKVSARTDRVAFRKGDYLIRLDQPGNRYLVETLEPTGPDGFFAWNFFDAILQEKEYYSDYRWDSLATAVLAGNQALRQEFQARKASDSTFRVNAEAQYDYIYRHSPWYEPEHLRYPVYRIEK